MLDLIYVIISLLSLSFLIFIHELGHYIAAKWAGMRVEAFSIGFGRPIFSWKRGEEQWKICWILFGGYVKISGMEQKNDEDPREIPDGFLAKSPLKRVVVAFAGPFVNLLFAVSVFALIWSTGGREKNFSEFTKKIGWVDPGSELYEKGVRAGDEVWNYDQYPVKRSIDHIYSVMLADADVDVKGEKISYYDSKRIAFSYQLKPYLDPRFVQKSQNSGIKTVGVLDSAKYLIYDYLPGKGHNPLLKESPLIDSGIQYGDRIVWCDGQVLFSLTHLKKLLNDHKTLLSIRRNNEVMHLRIPRRKIIDFRLSKEDKAEISDWKFENSLEGKIDQIRMIPYMISPDCIVEKELEVLDAFKERKDFQKKIDDIVENPLKSGDRILAVDGKKVDRAEDFLKEVQKKQLYLIVHRSSQSKTSLISWKNADRAFDTEVDWKGVSLLAHSIGLEKAFSRQSGNLYLIGPIEAKQAQAYSEIQFASSYANAEQEQKARSLLTLGIRLQDRRVAYNPYPHTVLKDSLIETWRTLKSLVQGNLEPEWMAGPVGIVQSIHINLSFGGLKDSIYWLAIISLNLAIFNLLPIPILDGGHIILAIFEGLFRRKIAFKTLEYIAIPFILLILSLFFFLTFNDLSRIWDNFF